ncbi:related to M.genitalium alanine--tRNA ligase [Cephalotrichum gorgonifer]|uniref:Related to M.genitalium alanine--tRNA ligase n=1 Tax=Cephalotrichum gorgonifer TaxID=2041049 RepID=A0AAE8MT43_9PEZI|nr:related to M.genitalium alanine--tRNA ligase [Cephalotrichum gorgonifer]
MTTPLHTQILSTSATLQNDSALFSVLPAEVRSHIFSFALTDYPDPSPDKRYEKATCYTRPSYFAPRRTDTALLQTCRAVYAESWFLPVLLREQADWWYWESDEPLRFEAQWIRRINEVMPSSVRETHIELESTVRRKGQVESIARQMREKWFFKRTDGVVLYPDATGANCEVSGWRGSSTWNGETWTRDETEPGVIDYYVISVPFRPEHVVKRRSGMVSGEARRSAETGIYNAFSMRLDTRGEHGPEDLQSDSDSDSDSDL